MSQLKAKQIAGPVSGKVGSAILFDGTKSGWSADLNTALSLPSGPTSARPQAAAAGHIRHNSETGKIEAFNGTSWTDVGLSKFTELTDGPGLLTGNANKLVRVNSGATALEYYTLPSVAKTFRFRANFTASTDPTSFTELPNGWTVSIRPSTTNTILINHGQGKPPSSILIYGSTSGSPTTYAQRSIIGNTAGVPGMFYDTSDMNTCWITNMTTTNSNTYNGGHVYIDLSFPL